MDNFDTIFDAFRNCITNPKCKDCPWEYCKKLNQTRVEIPLDLCLDVVELLKEQKKIVKEARKEQKRREKEAKKEQKRREKDTD